MSFTISLRNIDTWWSLTSLKYSRRNHLSPPHHTHFKACTSTANIGYGRKAVSHLCEDFLWEHNFSGTAPSSLYFPLSFLFSLAQYSLKHSCVKIKAYIYCYLILFLRIWIIFLRSERKKGKGKKRKRSSVMNLRLHRGVGNVVYSSLSKLFEKHTKKNSKYKNN